MFNQIDYENGNGGAFDLPDERDYRAEHLLGIDATVELPKRVLLTEKSPLTHDQDSTMHCTAYGLTHCVEAIKSNEHNIQAVADPEEQWANQKYDNGGLESMEKNGDSLQHALKVFKKSGLNNKSPDIVADKFSATGYAVIGNTLADIRYWLSKGYPLYSGSGNHCYAIVGYDDDLKVIYWKNSYGPNCPKKNSNGIGTKAYADVGVFFSKYVIYLNMDTNYIFKDVSDKSPMADSIKWARDIGLMTGYGTDEDLTKRAFMPEKAITRAEMTVVMKRFYDLLKK
jgi:hypothetical protein